MTAAVKLPRLLILGAGCAGLSLAYRLAQATPALDVMLVDARREYVHDRTWSGFRITPHPFENCRLGQWHWLDVADKQEQARLDCGRYYYESIHSGQFYQRCLAALDSAAHVTRVTSRVAHIIPDGHPPGVILENGERLLADWIVDTLPRPAPLKAPWRWQDFAGWELESPTLAQKPPLLMDFSVAVDAPENDALDFVYRLPFADNRVLVEWTRFGRPAADPLQLENHLKHYLAHAGIHDYRLVRREYGSLPMAPGQRNGAGRHQLAGAYGGAMRASTGYAFHAIQRWADQCSQQLCEGQGPIAPGHSALLGQLDSIFMQALDQTGENAHRLYLSLFRHCPGEPLIRFLSGVPTARDYTAIMTALPPLTMLKAAAAQALHRWPYLPTLRQR